jgi:hypothetical protein
VTITGVGGCLFHDRGGNSDGKITTQRRRNDRPSAWFVVERAPASIYGRNSRYVSFSCYDKEGSDEKMYLTQHLYGDQAKAEATETLLGMIPEKLPLLLPELVPNIVDFAVESATDTENFEGGGFHYAPMTYQPAASPPAGSSSESVYPSWQQIFTLEEIPAAFNRTNSRAVFIRSYFGNYWRSAHWNHVISQSKNCLRDEAFYIRPAAPP